MKTTVKARNAFKRLSKITLIRGNIAPSLAATLPGFIFWNVGTVTEAKGRRICCEWPGSGPLWFDDEALVFADLST